MNPKMIPGDPLSGRDFSGEFRFVTSRSSGPGGQNVNKVSTKVELRFDIPGSCLLTDNEKDILQTVLKNKISAEGILIIVSQSERSQLKNKGKAVDKFYSLLIKALTPKKKRKPSKPTKASKEKRLEEKKLTAEKKARRTRPDASK
ncbi:MAG: alternative ribosome rescue aminoacyl-tRNA hydrolase ArfB [Bacteroidetes bacterium]|nr:alternative ribosome rescue aminoacyl-tRNA hydrolase ArfB [Bacteroidota bacterium]